MLERISQDHYRLQGQLDMKNNLALLTELFSVVNDKKNSLNQLQLDVSELQSADSILLATIIHVARTMESRNGVLRIIGFPARLQGLAKTYGVDSLIEKYMVTA